MLFQGIFFAYFNKKMAVQVNFFRAFLAYFLEKICIFALSIPTLCQPRRMTNLVKGGGHLADVRLYGRDTT